MKIVRAEAPATIANLGPCFDALGIALSEPKDIVELSLDESSDSVVIEKIEGLTNSSISFNTSSNTAGLAVKTLINRLGLKIGLKIKIRKGIRPASGMGSSGASAAAAVYGLSNLLGLNENMQLLVEAAAEGERAAANFPHADNVAAALLGGVVVLKSHKPLEFINFPVPEKLRFAIVLPDVELVTADSRAVLPSQIGFRDSFSQLSSCAFLVAALLKGDLVKIGRAVNSDIIVEPARARLIKGFSEVKKAALEAGAYGCSICGSGPSIFAVCDESIQENILGAMEDALKNLNIKFIGFKAKPSNEGAKIIG
ncbi:MAG: homoserine kinase [Candidatus Odinarchaeum yellowstonii]|uniref:Homoserine kinase n=1 Tax=Odinarchaeota yellowstonii (strain LCB_4) TaxID=1841599 RepID=A0AAF0D313_ODILC|nr:MAG: homoserine kinase [Candidatus Odinarchaeum yellowstonii]